MEFQTIKLDSDNGRRRDIIATSPPKIAANVSAALFSSTTAVDDPSTRRQRHLAASSALTWFLSQRDIATHFDMHVFICLVADAPRITHPPRDQKVVDNGVVSFHCLAVGNPVPEVYWKRAGRRIVGSSPGLAPAAAAGAQPQSTPGGSASTATSGVRQPRHYVIAIPHGSVLRIEPVKARRDDGLVECVADNGVGEPATAAANVEVYAEGIGKQLSAH
jgi:hypothetical protein